jgi:hypothetical protein
MAVVVSLAWAYAEEEITFRDPYTGQPSNVEISTIHTDLTYVLALAAGFSIDDSRTLMIWNQLVDSNLITTTDTSYSNCSGTFPISPTMELVCQDTSGELFWPDWENVPNQEPGTSCVTSRYGPFEGFFHFPHRDGPEMAALQAWGWGTAQELVGYQGYVWGPPDMLSFFGWTCFYTQPLTIDTGMTPGSLEAFATYLHSLADSYSHQRCQEKTDALGWAWPTHTYPYPPVPITETIYECNYAPNRLLKDIGDSHHGREFGDREEWSEDSGRTDKAVRAVYGELVARSRQREGVYLPLSLDTPLQGITDTPTLSAALSVFVHNWNFDEPAKRREYADDLSAAILAQRLPAYRTFLPVVWKDHSPPQ